MRATKGLLRGKLIHLVIIFLGALLVCALAVQADQSRGNRYVGHHGITTYEGSKTCNQCHEDEAQQVYNSEHYQWKGKLGAINDFCTYPDANWLFEFPAGNTVGTAAGCATCHVGFDNTKPPGVGAYFPSTPTQAHLDKIDCLMCHSDTYNHVGKMVNGQPVLVPDAASQTNMVSILAGIKKTPSKEACLKCHAKAGGGNGIKQGDLDLSMANPPHELDVHMSSNTLGGAGLTCVSCHSASDHKIAGKGSDMRVADPGSPKMKRCTTCHGTSPHDSGDLNEHLSEARADCTACHIPTYARGVPTETDRDFTSLVPINGRYEAERTEGMILTPELLPYDGISYFYKLGTTLTKQVSEGGINRYLIAGPNSVAGGSTSGRLYPFKVHTGLMAVDAKRRLIPINSLELWGNAKLVPALGGYGAVPFTFVETVRYLGVYHQVAPKEAANDACIQCHGPGGPGD
jgi:hypothetical protein